MSHSNIHFTNRMLRIMGNAEKEALLSKFKVLLPAHLFIACLNEKTGVIGEIVLKSTLDMTSLRKMINDLEQNPINSAVKSEFFDIAVSEEVVNVF